MNNNTIKITTMEELYKYFDETVSTKLPYGYTPKEFKDAFLNAAQPTLNPDMVVYTEPAPKGRTHKVKVYTFKDFKITVRPHKNYGNLIQTVYIPTGETLAPHTWLYTLQQFIYWFYNEYNK